MLSRVAERFYWFGRYVERAENTARLILTYADLVLDLPRRSSLDWHSLVEISGSQALFEDLGTPSTETGVMRFLIDEERNPSSIRSSIELARENLRTTRDRVPREVFEAMNKLRDFSLAQGPSSIRRSGARSVFLRQIMDQCQMLRGYTGGSMSHNAAYRFIRIGRLLERADMTTRIMDVRFDDLLPDEVERLPAFDAIQWMSVLRSLSAYQMYRRQVHGRVQAHSVIDFLFSDREFPRSVSYALLGAQRSVFELPRPKAVLDRIDVLIQRIDELKTGALAQDNSRLRKTIDDIQGELNQIHLLVSQTYFALEQD